MAVKAPYGPTSVFDRASTFPVEAESAWSIPGMNQPNHNAMHGNMYVERSTPI